MKIKLFVPLILALFWIFSPSENAFAYTGGLIQGKTGYRTTDFDVQSGTGTASTVYTDGSEGATSPMSPSGGSTDVLYYDLGGRYKINSMKIKMDYGFTVYLLNQNYEIVYSQDIPGATGVSSNTINFPYEISGVYRVAIENKSESVQLRIYEVDFFGSPDEPDSTPPFNVSDLAANNITYNSFSLSWTKPSDSDTAGYKIYKDENLIGTTAQTNFSISDLSPMTQYNIRVTAYDTSGNENTGVNLTVRTNAAPDTTAPSNVSNLVAAPKPKSVLLSWTNPPETDFARVKIYENGIYQKTVVKEETTALFENLEPETTYTFKITSVDETGNESAGTTITTTTPPLPPVENIKNLKTETKFDRVKLSWELPQTNEFHHVNIYRKNVEKQGLLSNLFGYATIKAYAAETADGYTPMFETNGTYWTDLTVKPSSEYEYKLTSTNTDGRESTGITTQAATEQEPKPELKGQDYKTDATGDYVITWTTPTTGDVKILLDGTLYKTVPAADLQATIPKEDIKIDGLGTPKVQLVPVSTFGTEGDRVSLKPQTVVVPFSANDLIHSGNGLLWYVAPLVLLALAFLLVPKFRATISAAFGKKETAAIETGAERRFTSDSGDQGDKKGEIRTITSKRIEREPRAKKEPRMSDKKPRAYRGGK